MKKTAAKLLVIASALLLLPIMLRAHEAPHTETIFGCACHNTHKKLDVGGLYANMCISCHRPTMIDRVSIGKTVPEYKLVRPFSYSDQANPFKNEQGLNNVPNKAQTSHKWSGPDNVPEAGALPPTALLYLPGKTEEKPMLVGTLACARCHNIDLPVEKLNENSKPYLRGLITEDQMCVDCHRPRNTANVMEGTHPVNVVYSSATSKSRQKPNEYYPRPVAANAANPTSQLPLKNGKVVCMTCHGIHYTDSNSFTVDGFTRDPSVVPGQYSSSQGYLLRTDLKRGVPEDRNICMNCHRSNDMAENNQLAAVKNHNGSTKQQNIQCADCHGGHVAFPGYSSAQYGKITAADQTPNIYLINRFMNVSSNTGKFKTIRNAKVLFNDASNKNAKGQYGVCVACHQTLPATVSQHAGANDWNVCKTCHTHKQGFSADCTTCHGFPPSANSAGGPNGYANTPYDYSQSVHFKDESATPHAVHAGGGTGYSYNCDQCHKGNSHADGTFTDVFKSPSGTLSPSAVYTPGDGTCTTVYCHSDGNGGYKPIPVWKGGAGKIVGQANECSSCHNYPATTNAHTAHTAGGTTGMAYSCSMCHSATIDNSVPPAIKDKAKHVNGAKDVIFADFAAGGIYDNGTKQCSNLYCHSDGKGGAPVTTPEFNNANTGKCGSCHLQTMVRDGHNAHISAVYGPQLNPATPLVSCAACHTYTGEFAATHVNGTVQVTTGSCNTCHPAGQPVWTGGTVSCESCHTGTTRSIINNITAPDKSLAVVSGHNKPSGANKACLACHSRNAQHLSPNPQVKAFRLLTSLSSATNPNKACTFCHNDITKVNNKAQFTNMSTHFTAKSGGQTMQCWQCHELHGTTNLSMIRSKFAYINSTSWTVTFTNTSTGMINKTTNRGLCQVCHTLTGHFRAGVEETSHPDKNCFDCHTHNSGGGAFKPNGGCNGCHGYPPAPKSAKVGPVDPTNYKGTFGTAGNYVDARFEDYSGGGGAHLWHVASNAKQSDGWLHCAKCHTNGTAHRTKTPLKQNINNVTVQIDNRYRFSDDTFPSYSGAKLVNPPAVNSTGSCVNVMCHFQPTPRWSKDR